MTRNEWIAETAREIDVHGWRKEDGTVGGFDSFSEAINLAVLQAERLEEAKVAPWQSAPPLTDAAAKVVEAAVRALDSDDDDCKLWAAVRAYKESVK